MKNKLRILTLFLAIALIVSTMTIPAFAKTVDDGDPSYSVSGIWVFNDTIDVSSNVVAYVYFNVDGQEIGNSYDFDYDTLEVRDKWLMGWNISSEAFYDFYHGGSWTNDRYKTINFGTTAQTVTDTFYTWLTANATPQSGSTTTPDSGTTPDDTTEITFSKYNYCKLPDINSVWTDHDTYKAAAIIRIKDSGTYRLIIGSDWINNYLYTEQYNGNDVEAYFLMGNDCMMYDLVGDVWTYVSTSSSGMYVRTATSDLVWSNTLLYDDYTKEFAYTHFFSQPRLTTVMTQRGLSGVMTEILKLIPMTTAFLVSYIALRKSWTFLLNLFQSA